MQLAMCSIFALPCSPSQFIGCGSGWLFVRIRVRGYYYTNSYTNRCIHNPPHVPLFASFRTSQAPFPPSRALFSTFYVKYLHKNHFPQNKYENEFRFVFLSTTPRYVSLFFSFSLALSSCSLKVCCYGVCECMCESHTHTRTLPFKHILPSLADDVSTTMKEANQPPSRTFYGIIQNKL